MRADARKNYDHILAVSRDLLAAEGSQTSMREIARTAGVGLGTLQRHFPTREDLLEALLRTSFDVLAERAIELGQSEPSDAALVTWLREIVDVAHRYSGAIKSMVAAIEDDKSALHASCTAMKAAGTRLLTSAQNDGKARTDVDGADLFALVGALAWVADQPALASRSDRLMALMSDALFVGSPES